MKKITPGYSIFFKGTGKSNLEFYFDASKLKFFLLYVMKLFFPNLIENNNNKYNFIINISEDAWFGKSIGPHQHFAKTIFRAIESRTFVVRSANKGKSAFIDPYGKVIKALKN